MSTWNRTTGSWRQHVLNNFFPEESTLLTSNDTIDYVNCDFEEAWFDIEEVLLAKFMQNVVNGDAWKYVTDFYTQREWDDRNVGKGLAVIYFTLSTDDMWKDALEGKLPFHIRTASEDYSSVD